MGFSLKIELKKCAYNKDFGTVVSSTASEKLKCHNPDCDRNEEHISFFYDNKTDKGYIKEGSTYAVLHFKNLISITVYLCRGCIDKVYKDFKMTLDSDLWAFH